MIEIFAILSLGLNVFQYVFLTLKFHATCLMSFGTIIKRFIGATLCSKDAVVSLKLTNLFSDLSAVTSYLGHLYKLFNWTQLQIATTQSINSLAPTPMVRCVHYWCLKSICTFQLLGVLARLQRQIRNKVIAMNCAVKRPSSLCYQTSWFPVVWLWL